MTTKGSFRYIQLTLGHCINTSRVVEPQSQNTTFTDPDPHITIIDTNIYLYVRYLTLYETEVLKNFLLLKYSNYYVEVIIINVISCCQSWQTCRRWMVSQNIPVNWRSFMVYLWLFRWLFRYNRRHKIHCYLTKFINYFIPTYIYKFTGVTEKKGVFWSLSPGWHIKCFCLTELSSV